MINSMKRDKAKSIKIGSQGYHVMEIGEQCILCGQPIPDGSMVVRMIEAPNKIICIMCIVGIAEAE